MPKGKVQACYDAFGTAYADQPQNPGGGGIFGGAGVQNATSTAHGALDQSAATVCKPIADSCTKACQKGTPVEQQQCKTINKLANAAQGGAIQAQSTANGAQASGNASGGMGGMMGPLLGAAAGGLLGYMLGKQQQKKQDQQNQQQQATNTAIQPNGSIDCTKSDAYQYADCDQYNLQTCVLNGLANLDTANCQSFSNRYCNLNGQTASSNGAPSSVPFNDGTTQGTMQVTMGGVGVGVGTQYCKNVLAYNYCKTPGRSSCPSCLQLQANQSATCQTNPAECLAQNSPDQIAQAKNTCPTDPAFSDPTYAAGGGAQVPSTVAAGGLAPVVLPSNTTGTGGSAPTVIASTGSVASATSSNGIRAGATNGNSASGRSAGNTSGIATSYASESIKGMARDVAGTMTAQSANAGGPAPDVLGAYGPSLFAMGTQVIQKRCDAGKLNCP